MDTIDWKLAQRIGEKLAGGNPYLGSHATDVEPLVEDFATRVCSYTGLSLTSGLPPLELVDRPRWIEANIATMKPMLEPLSSRIGEGTGPLAGAMRSLSGPLLGMQVGAVAGVLSQRVLGQYDIALLDPEPAPRLLLVAPNLAAGARNLGVDRDQLTAWVAIHEVTHAVQFAGVPWLRPHLAHLLAQLVEGLDVKVNMSRSLRLPDPDDLRALARRLRGGELLRLTLGEDRWEIVDRMQATMSLVEGHAEHVMDAVGAEVLPTLEQLRAAMTRRRRERTWPWRILERLLGMEMKLRQYEVGRRFCDEIVAQAGPTALTLAWSSEEMLPSTAELQSPGAWLARTQVRPPAA